jgi:ferrous iron transport protein A
MRIRPFGTGFSKGVGAIVVKTTTVQRTLDTFSNGESGTVISVDSSAPLGRRLLEVGLTPGIVARVIRRAPLGDPIQVSLPDGSLTLRAYEASLVRMSSDL